MKGGWDVGHDERHLRAKFDAALSFTVGAEEELLLIDPSSGMPIPAAELAVAPFLGDARVATEFRASQVEIVSPVCVAVADVARELGAARTALASALGPQGLVAAIGTHPLAVDPGPITDRPRYSAIALSQPWAARHMMTCGLHVHVAVSGADRALAVHNAMRSSLPELVALAANAPFHGGTDSGMATVRPSLNRSLARFGAPPAFASWGELSTFLAWAHRSAAMPDPGCLWWDLRLNLTTATLEVRAADVQTRVGDSAAIIALVQCLAHELAARHDAGDGSPIHDRDRISESMFLASRDGLLGFLPDLDDGTLTPTAERVSMLADRLRPSASELGCVDELDDVHRLVREGGGATRQREIEGADGLGSMLTQLAAETAGPAATAPDRNMALTIA